MKKLILPLFCIVLSASAGFAQEIFNHKIAAKSAASQMPEFESKSCKFSQTKLMKSSNVELKSGGNFKFIKNEGVVFDTTYPIHSQTSYNASKNKNINAIVKSVVNKNYSYLEKNFDIYFLKTDAQKWSLALKPRTDSQIKGEIQSIQMAGETKNGLGLITKMLIDTLNTKTTIYFTDCR